MVVEKKKEQSALANVYDWMHRDGEPDPNTMPADTIILMDIAISLRHLVRLAEEAKAMNQAILIQLDRGEDDDGQKVN